MNSVIPNAVAAARRRAGSAALRMAAAALAMMLLLTACLSLGVKKEFAVYGLTLDAPVQEGPVVKWQLLIDLPTAPDPVSTQRIVLKPGDSAFGVFENARWTDRGPELFQALLLQGFERSKRIIGVGRLSSSVGGDLALTGELRSFEAIYPPTGEVQAHIVYSAKLIHYPTSRVLAARVFEQRIRSSGRDLPAVVEAFDRGVEVLIPEVVDWALVTGEANWQAAYPRPR